MSLARMQRGECISCGAPLTDENNVGGICTRCDNPEQLEARIQMMPEPLRSTFLRVGRRIGALSGEADGG